MNAVTRWKTIATIALAFSAGNLFATACQNAGSGKANAEDGTTEDGTTGDGTTGDGTTGGGDGSTPPPDLADVERDIASIKCFIGHMTDDRTYDGRGSDRGWSDITDGEEDGWDQGPSSDSLKAYEDCF
jgi:hypothetical protein